MGVKQKGAWICSWDKAVLSLQQVSLHGALSTWVLQRAVHALKVSILRMLMWCQNG